METTQRTKAPFMVGMTLAETKNNHAFMYFDTEDKAEEWAFNSLGEEHFDGIVVSTRVYKRDSDGELELINEFEF